MLATTDIITGETTWSLSWDGGYGYEEIDGISIESDGIIITGWSKGNGTEMDVLLMKIAFDGSIIWQTVWGSETAKDDHQDGHIVVDDSFIFISGLYDGSPLLGWDGKALLAKFDKSSGSLVDSLTYGRQDQWVNAENALGMTTDGTYLYTTGYTTTAPNNWDVFVAKFDKDLNQLWYTTWGGENTETARAITVDDDGSIYIGANTSSFSNGDFDMSLLKLNHSGNVEWYKTWGANQDDQILDIHLSGSKLYITGKTQSFHPTEKWEAVLLKVDLENITSTKSIFSISDKQLHVSPNPTSSFATVRIDSSIIKPQELSVYNSMGQKVKVFNKIETKEIVLDKRDLGTGVFFIQLVDYRGVNGIATLIVD